MTASATLVVLFAGSLSSGERAELARHAKHERIELVAPRPTPRSSFAAFRPELVADLEGRLEEARTLAASLDEERALASLAAIEVELRRSPELPQLSFLLAERYRIEAELRRGRPGETSQADELAARALSLEGARARTFGEGEVPSPTAPTLVTVTVSDLGPRDILEVDGEPGPRERRLPAGSHHARVLRATELVWAGFVEVPPGGALPGPLRVGVRPVTPCSAEDFGTVDARGRAPKPEPGTLCPRWIAVRRALGRLEVSDCAKEHCPAFAPLARPVAERREGVDWLRAALVGAGTAGAILGVLWASGSFDREAPPDQRVWVWRGIP